MTGPQGDPGLDGPQGPQGVRGDMVVIASSDGGFVSIDGGIAIVTGPVGPQGAQGVAGSPGANGAAGQSVTGSISEGPSSNCQYGGVRYDSVSGAAYVCNGAPGAVGPTGDGGPQGPIGPQGVMGLSGPMGPQGEAGAPGRDGDQFGEIAARFAGFTTQTTNGAAGGRHALHGLCQQAFPGAHMCHAAEFARSNSSIDIPAGGAWVDLSATITATGGESVSVEVSTPDSARAVLPIAMACNNWNSAAAAVSGGRVTASAQNMETCDTVLPVACCSTPFRERFAGFTVFTSNGNIGGRAAANRRCAAEFTGAHLCHVAEFVRASSGLAAPVGGAWIDRSSIAPVNGGLALTTQNGHGHASPFVTASSAGCSNWTNSGIGDSLAIIPTGILGSSNCDVVRSLACCM